MEEQRLLGEDEPCSLSRTLAIPLIAYRLALGRKKPLELVLFSPQRSLKRLLDLIMFQE